MPDRVLALDFGGTKLAAAVVAAHTGQIVSQVRRPTPAAGGAPAVLAAMLAAGQAALEQAASPAIQGVGISFGGPVSADRRTVLRSLHVAAWEGLALPERLAQAFGAPAWMDNDGNAAALGEWVFGAGQGVDHLLYVQVSTGVGAGLVLNRQVYRGGGLAGEFGHLIVEAEGPQCTCGQRGCVESLCAGWALARDGRDLLARGASSRLAELTGGDPQQVSAELVLRLAQAGDPAALAIARRAFAGLAAGLAHAICLLDPPRIVIGGGVARAQALLRSVLEPCLHEMLPVMLRERVDVTFARLGGQETLLGAALLTQGY